MKTNLKRKLIKPLHLNCMHTQKVEVTEKVELFKQENCIYFFFKFSLSKEDIE